MKKWTWPRLIYRLLFWWLWVSPILVQAAAYPVVVSDASGAALTFIREPARVVSLVPSATEMLLALGLRESVAALTYHDAALPGAGDKPIVGGFFSPQPENRRGGPAGPPDYFTTSSVPGTAFFRQGCFRSGL